jgi:hypothetical protein
MSRDISFLPMRVLIDGHDTDGRLVLADSQLAAVFVRLDGTHHDPEHKQRWRLEAGAWVEQILMRKAASLR